MGPRTGNRIRATADDLPGEQECVVCGIAQPGECGSGGAAPANLLECGPTILEERYQSERQVMTESPFLSLSLDVSYRNKPEALKSVFLQMRQGEVLGLIGQSGSGKSTLALAILRLLELKGGKASGTIFFQGRDLLKLKEREMRELRGSEIGLVLQSPLSSLNPALRIGTQLTEAWKAHASGPRDEARRRIQDALSAVSLPSDDEF